jgi:hypothetical protein
MHKLYYLINEPFEGYQTGYRKALEEVKQQKLIDDVKYFSFFSKEKTLGSWGETLRIIHDEIISYQPSIILIAHLSGHQFISKSVVLDINRSLPKKPVWVYDERDVYGVIRKHLSLNVLRFASYCDLVTLCTYGSMARRFRRWGSMNTVYLPHAYDSNFGTPWVPTAERKYDVILIANRVPSRVPFLSMPGVREREKIVRIFSRTFGQRFAVFGRGWNGWSSEMGPTDFFEQERLARTSWLTIGMDHFYDYAGYFSDRLPIALVSGVPHLTYRAPGLDKLFVDKQHLFYFSNPEEAVRIATELLDGPKERLMRFGETARAYVIRQYSESRRFTKIIELAQLHIGSTASQ